MEQKPLRHPVLYGEYDLTIDEKNRLSVPSDIRKAINPQIYGDAFFLIGGINQVPWLYPERYYEDLVTQVTPEITPGEDLLAFDQINFALATKLPLDDQGRLSFREKTMKRTRINREVTLIGVRDHLELWNRADWETRREFLEARASEIALRAKQARQSPKKPDPDGN
jgi:MraZ protein